MRYSVLFLLTCIAGGFLAQKPIVRLVVEPTQIEKGQPIQITVKANVQGQIKIDYPSAFIEGYSMANGMEQETDYNTGKIITLFYYAVDGTFKKEGTFTIGPAYINSGGKVYKSNTVSVTVKREIADVSSGEVTAKQLRQLAFGVIEKSKTKIYEGEPILLNAKIYSRFYPSSFDDYQSYSPDGTLEKHNLSPGGKIAAEETRIKGIAFYTFEYDRNLIFPTNTGKLRIDPFKLILRRDFDGLPIVSTACEVEVMPLPGKAPKSFIGMVGKLEMKQEFDKNEVKKGDVLHCLITLSGTGNLQNIVAPKLNLPAGMTIYGDPKVSEDLTYSASGAEGKVTFDFSIKVNTSGTIHFPATEVSYFDPKTAKYVKLTAENQVFDGEEIQAKSNTSGTTVTREANPNQKETSESVWKSPVLWVSLGSVLVLALGVGFFARPRGVQPRAPLAKNSPILAERKEQAEKFTYSETERKADISSIEILLSQNDQHGAATLLEQVIAKTCASELGCCPNDFSVQKLVEKYSERYPNELRTEQLKTMLAQCQEVRYGLGGGLNGIQKFTL